VLIDLEGRAKVTDFGIARSLELDGLTAAGRVLGTTDYVAPEQAIGEGATEQSDIYSLGVCLWEMLSGEVPFKGDNQVAVAMQHVRDPLPDIQQRRPEVSAGLASGPCHRGKPRGPGDRRGDDGPARAARGDGGLAADAHPQAAPAARRDRAGAGRRRGRRRRVGHPDPHRRDR
jgi:serine/threonine protein kinase